MNPFQMNKKTLKEASLFVVSLQPSTSSYLDSEFLIFNEDISIICHIVLNKSKKKTSRNNLTEHLYTSV
jgi:hypothetical protein